MKTARDKLCTCGHEAAAHLVNARSGERGECSVCGRGGCPVFHTGRRRKTSIVVSESSTGQVVIDAAALARVRLAASGVAKAMAMLCTEIEKLEARAPKSNGTTSKNSFDITPLVMAPRAAAPVVTKIGGGLRRILVVLAQATVSLTDAQICIRADLSASGGTYGTYLSRARSMGWLIDFDGNRRTISDAGRKALGSYEQLPREGAELRAYWQRKIDPSGAGKSGLARIFNVVAAAHPHAVMLTTVAARADVEMTGGSFGTYLSRLRTLMLVEDVVVNGEKGLMLGSELR